MAKINISVDTEEKKPVVTIDGQELKNVVSVSIFQEDDPDFVGRFNLSITTHEKTEDGMRKSMVLRAKETKEGQQILQAGGKAHADFKDFIIDDKDPQCIEDAVNYLLSRR